MLKFSSFNYRYCCRCRRYHCLLPLRILDFFFLMKRRLVRKRYLRFEYNKHYFYSYLLLSCCQIRIYILFAISFHLCMLIVFRWYFSNYPLTFFILLLDTIGHLFICACMCSCLHLINFFLVNDE